MKNLKERLLGLGVFEDNEYLDLYCSLIEQNLETKKEKYKTQAHHFIPVCVYDEPDMPYDRKALTRQAAADKNNFTTNLLFKDHVQAHYLLAKCSLGSLRGRLICAYIRMTQLKGFQESSQKALQEYQQLYEEYRHYNNHFRGKKHSAEWCKQHSEQLRGHLGYERTPENKAKISTSLKRGHAEGRYRISPEARQRKAHVGASNGRYGTHYKSI